MGEDQEKPRPRISRRLGLLIIGYAVYLAWVVGLVVVYDETPAVGAYLAILGAIAAGVVVLAVAVARRAYLYLGIRLGWLAAEDKVEPEGSSAGWYLLVFGVVGLAIVFARSEGDTGWLGVGIPTALLTAAIIAGGLRFQRGSPRRRWPVIAVGLLAGLFAGLAMFQAIWAERRWPHRRRAIDGIAIAVGAGLTLVAVYGALGPPFGIGPLIDSGRIERIESGYAITLPREWRVEDISKAETLFGDAIPPGMKPELAAATASLDQIGYILAFEDDQESRLEEMVYGLAASLAADPDVLAVSAEPANTNAAPTYRVSMTFDDGRRMAVYPLTRDGRAYHVLYFASREPPDDSWLSIAETFEYLDPPAGAEPTGISQGPRRKGPTTAPVAVEAPTGASLSAALGSVEPGGRLQLDGGPYVGGVEIGADITIAGASDGTTVILVPQDQPGIKVNGGALSVEGITFRGHRAGDRSPPVAIDVRGGSASVSDCTISDVRVGILVAAGATGSADGCRISDVSEFGMLLVGPGTQGSLVASEIVADSTGLAAIGGAGVTVRESTIEASGMAVGMTGAGGSARRALGADVADPTKGRAPSSVSDSRITSPELGIQLELGASPVIVDSTITGTRTSAIEVYGEGTAPIVRGNEIDGGEWGIGAWDGSEPTIEANTITGSETGIEVTASSGIVRGNHISGATWGLSLYAGATPVITDNTIVETTNIGIVMEGARTSPEVRANEIAGGDWGIAVLDGSDPVVEDNTITGTDTGIEVDGASGTVRGNTIVGGTRGVALLSGTTTVVSGNTISDPETAIIVEGQGASPVVRGNRVSGAEWGIAIVVGSDPVVEENTIRATETGIEIDAASGTVRGNQISGATWGVAAQNGATASLSDNVIVESEAWGIGIEGEQTTPVIRGNEISGGEWGIAAWGGADPVIEDNSISGVETGIDVDAAAGSVQGNQVSEASWGVIIQKGATPHVAGNTIVDSGTTGVQISGPGTAPVFRDNRIEGGGWGLVVDEGAAPTIEGNAVSGFDSAFTLDASAGTVRGNRVTSSTWGLSFSNGATTVAEGNVISETQETAVYIVGVDTAPVVHANEIDGAALGVWIGDRAQPTITGNVISNTVVGIHAGPGTVVTLGDNDVSGSSEDIEIMPGARTLDPPASPSPALPAESPASAGLPAESPASAGSA